ncbi:hypothetical protein PI23P_02422 [Polaribacter irgensii 23-P]|uniref:Gas vesicle synthesis GvpLGvpF n=1 Tax=Polaribacter irgensii 23-P TaxID=313594 RepID=A4BWH1_9FLAO|nr:GvpL/GvpF family gas vesicle protein [Polaribacter irgensii]EAR13312.1 hypothetical protein PI23P_02422 [Polaribacter irgensii 23-P]
MKKVIYAILLTNQRHRKMRDLVKGMKGIMGAEIYALSFKDVSIAVSDFTSSKDTTNRELAIDFAGVIEVLSQQITLLPVRFGTFIKTDEIVHQLLVNHYDSFFRNLQKVENKCEFGLKILCDYDTFSKKISAQAAAVEVQPLAYFSANTIHTNYLLEKIKINKLEDSLFKYVEQLIEDISQHLTQINPESKYKKMVTNSILLDAVFLVKENKKDEFIQAISSFKQQHDDLQFLLTGSWPPYSFVDIVIE